MTHAEDILRFMMLCFIGSTFITGLTYGLIGLVLKIRSGK